MTGWWQSLSLREKGLVAAAATILVLIIGWYLVLLPSISARTEAREARQQAADQLVQLERLVAARRARSPGVAGIAVSTSAALEPDAFKTEVTRTAQAAGLAISRLQGNEGDRFALVFEQADARQLFYWMNEVEARLGGRIERLSMDQAQNGRVRATVELSGGEAG